METPPLQPRSPLLRVGSTSETAAQRRRSVSVSLAPLPERSSSCSPTLLTVDRPNIGPSTIHVLTESGDDLVHKVEHMDTVINAHASAQAEGIHPPLEKRSSAMDNLKSLFQSPANPSVLDEFLREEVQTFTSPGHDNDQPLRATTPTAPSVPSTGNSTYPRGSLTIKVTSRSQKIHPQEDPTESDRNMPSSAMAPPTPEHKPISAPVAPPLNEPQKPPNVTPTQVETHGTPPSSRPSSPLKRIRSDMQQQALGKRRSSITSITEGVQSLARSASKMLDKSQQELLEETRQAKVAELMEKDVMVLNENQLAKMQMRNSDPFTISVDSSFRRWWDFVIALCMAYVTIAVPIKVGFAAVPSGVGHSVDLLIDILFLSEIPLNLFTSYIDDSTGEEVKQLRKIRENYLYGYFILDAMSSFPASMIDSKHGLITLCRLLKLARVYKISRSGLFKAIRSRVNRTMNPSMMRMLELTGIFLISQHFIACTYYFISLNQDEVTTWQPSDVTRASSLITKYVHAMYFAIMVTTANDVNPTTTTEKLFTSVMLFVGIVINASIIGSAANLLSNLDKAEIARKNQMDGINDFMRFKKVPIKLQEKIRRYYEYALNGRINDPIETLFAELPDRLKLSLRLNLHDEFIRKVPLFRVCSNAGVIAIIQCMKHVVAMAQEVIIEQGEMASEFYFIKNGRVSLCVRLPHQEIPLGNLGEGSFFGESSLLTGEPQQAEVKSESITELAYLTKEDFASIVDKFPTFYLAVRRISENRMQTAQNVQRMTKMQRRQSNPHVMPMQRRTTLKKVAESVISGTRLAGSFRSAGRKFSESPFGQQHGTPDSSFIRLSQRFSSSRRNSSSGLFTANYLERISLGQARHLSTLRSLDDLTIDSSASDPLWN